MDSIAAAARTDPARNAGDVAREFDSGREGPTVQRFNCRHSARRLLASIRRVNIAVISWADAKGLFNMTLFVTPFEAQPPEL
jgi:hypothetical protein